MPARVLLGQERDSVVSLLRVPGIGRSVSASVLAGRRSEPPLAEGAG
jgi:hypothetical protein